MQAPSLSNSTGTLLGTLAGALVASKAATIPLVITAAGSLGMPPVALAGVLAVGATALVNYGVTHWAELANINELAKEWYPQIQPIYPTGKNGQPDALPVAEGAANANINKG